ncbi:hypothetical protein KBI23_18755 [bacterium]|nr:hypothetical protein [bacterium]MBP9809731.1 hypothetical protein [bacterium]
MNMNIRDLQDRSHLQDRTNYQDAGQDRFNSWTQQASNDATDFFRSQSRSRTPDRMAQNMLDSLEITPLFVSVNNTSDHCSHSHSRDSHDTRNSRDGHRNSMNGERITIDLGIGGSALVIDTVRDRRGNSEVQLISRLNQRRPEELNRTMPYDRYNSLATGQDILPRDRYDSPSPSPATDTRPLPPCPPGFDQTKWENGHDTIKYAVGRELARSFDQLLAIPDEAGQRKFAENFLKTQVPNMEARGGKVLAIKDEKVLLDAGDGSGPLWIDVVKNIGGGNPEVQWTVLGKGDASQTRAPEFAPTPPGFDPVKWDNGHDTPKYFVGHLVADMLQDDLLNPDRDGQKARVEQFLKKQVPAIEAKGIKVHNVIGEKILVDVHDGTGVHWVDTVVDVGGRNPHASWQVEA